MLSKKRNYEQAESAAFLDPIGARCFYSKVLQLSYEGAFSWNCS